MTASTDDFTITNLRDAEDMALKHGLSEIQEMRSVRTALGCQLTGLSLQRLKPNQRSAFGHVHGQQEEIYAVLAGSGRIKLGDEIRDLQQWDAVRVAPATPRAFEAGPDGLEYLAFGGPTADQSDAEMLPEFWPLEGE